MPRIVSGGGINSRQVVQSKKGQKVEPTSHKANVAGVAQQGLATQFRKEPLEAGSGYQPRAMPDTGVRGTFNSSAQGPGSGRTIHRSGSQGVYGPVAQGEVNRAPDPPSTAPGRDILSDYGPERRR
jgi:hypothetical protein